MDNSILWIPAVYHPIGKEIDNTGSVFIPLYQYPPRYAPDYREQLFNGILLAVADPPGACSPTDRQYLEMLELSAREMGSRSADEYAAYMFSRNPFNLFERITEIRALRRAVELIPDGFFSRCALMALLWHQAEKEPGRAPELCPEIAGHLAEIDPTRTAECRDLVLYSGLASMVYLGKKEKYSELKLMHWSRIEASNWLARAVRLLDSVQPECFADVADARWTWILDSPPKSAKELQDTLDMAKSIGSPPPGIITSTLLICWSQLEEPLTGDRSWYKGAGPWAQDQTFLGTIISSGKRREEVLEHLYHFSPSDWEACFAKLLSQSDRAKTRKDQLARAGMPPLGKQIIGQVCDYSMKLAEDAGEIEGK